MLKSYFTFTNKNPDSRQLHTMKHALNHVQRAIWSSTNKKIVLNQMIQSRYTMFWGHILCMCVCVLPCRVKYKTNNSCAKFLYIYWGTNDTNNGKKTGNFYNIECDEQKKKIPDRVFQAHAVKESSVKCTPLFLQAIHGTTDLEQYCTVGCIYLLTDKNKSVKYYLNDRNDSFQIKKRMEMAVWCSVNWPCIFSQRK